MTGRHTAVGRRAALAAVGALVVTTLPTAASAAAPPAPGPRPTASQTLGADSPPAGLLTAMGRDLGLTPNQAATRLLNEAEAGTRAGRLRTALDSHFAGAWLSGPTSASLTVATTDAADVPTIRAEGATAVVVATTLAELEAVRDRLDAAADSAEAIDTPLWYVDVPANRVAVQATSRSAAEAFVESAGVAAEEVAVQVSEERPRVLADLVGGDPYYIDNVARCSVGFSVTRSWRQGFATAGHCGGAGARTTGYNRAAQGVVQGSTFPGRDMAWVAVNGAWRGTPYVRAQSGRRVRVAGSVRALIGSAVCRSGSTTGWRCGIVERHNVTVRYPQGRVYGLTRTTVCAEPGDSGGPYVSGAQAQGVTSGGSGNCRVGGRTYFQPINPLLSRYGLTLRTTSSQAAPLFPAPLFPVAVADAWTAGLVYETGATVTRAGVRYTCLQDHQAQSDWSPEDTPALWQRL
ncbi:carbohydrate-binding protein [Streptomyces sp. HSG2]|uniref:trypsin-like serine protease n=1 Tax=Streptomyces sp. HSG2 TaxID=2797167 RepID=UPI00190365F8|nr:carbohydrate-binding protein [Streptomyces sp. HSG2]